MQVDLLTPATPHPPARLFVLVGTGALIVGFAKLWVARRRLSE